MYIVKKAFELTDSIVKKHISFHKVSFYLFFFKQDTLRKYICST